MCSNVMVTASLCALLALAMWAAPADSKAVLEAEGRGQGEGLLSTLISLAKTPAALGSSEETEQEDVPASDGDTKAVKPAGERGIHKKKLWYYHIWNVVYWYLWVFAAVAIKFKIAFLIIWGHLTYFLVALIRVLIREVPLWVQLKREPVPVYGPQYGPAPPQYGSNSYATSSYAAPFKRRLGDTPQAHQQAHQQAQQATTGAQELAYAGHRK